MKRLLALGLLASCLGLYGCGPKVIVVPAPEDTSPTGQIGLPATQMTDSWTYKVNGRTVEAWVKDLSADYDGPKYTAALEALTKAGPKAVAAVTVLSQRIEDNGPNTAKVRLMSVKAIGAIGPDAVKSGGRDPGADGPAMPALVTCIVRGNKELTEAATEAIKKLGPAAIPGLIEGVKNGELNRAGIADVIATFGPKAKAAVPALIDILSRDPKDSNSVRISAAKALGAIGPDAKEAVDALKETAKDKDEAVKTAAEEALAKIEGKKS